MAEGNKTTIEPYKAARQTGVLDLILPIQQEEFGVEIKIEDQPDLLTIPAYYQHGNGNFWTALHEGAVVGSVALVDIGNDQVALRKMFVAKEFRGKEKGISQKLLSTVFDWCKQKEVREIFLGSTNAFHAAHRFYEKNGFREIRATDLPPTFPRMHVDTIFYRYELKPASVYPPTR
jgi:N-acetylglutamate synthase-like GNAT family acetyltransferase